MVIPLLRGRLMVAGVTGSVLLAWLTGLAPQVVAAPAPVAAASAGATLPDQIGARAAVRQMVTVSARGWSQRYAVLKAWQRDASGTWRLAHEPVRVVVGYNGWAPARERRQSSGTTPAGRFRLPYAFGNASDPGAHLQYRRVDADDWWPYEPRDPATYNVWQWHRAPGTDWRADYAERLASYGAEYAYGIVVGFNLPSAVHYSASRRQWVAADPANLRRGGGIFLHVRGDGPTAGCVAMPRAEMRWLVAWLRPRLQPRIVMGPRDYIVKL